jgi:hypothetical protein
VKQRFANGTIIAGAVGLFCACTVVIGDLPEGKPNIVYIGGSGGEAGVAGTSNGGLAGAAGVGNTGGSGGIAGGGSGGVSGAGSGGVSGASGAGGGSTCINGECDCDGDEHASDSVACGGDDCDDKDDRAYTGQTAYFFTKTLGNNDFDFNCDGADTPELKQHKCGNVALCAGAVVGYLSAPVCGTDGVWAKCVGTGIGCTPSPDGTVPVVCH